MESKKELDKLVGENIKRERVKAGLTQERFSEMIGMGPKSLSAVERGTVGISLPSLKRVCKVLSISSDALIFGEIEQQDTSDLTDRLARLSPEQYKITSEIINKLLEAFSL